MKLAVIGCGYVGLVSGSCLAEAGHEVIATDNDASKIATLQAGKIPIYEPNLDKVLETVVREGRLRFTANGGEAVRESDVVFICVGTPPTDSGDADLSAIDSVARMIARESRTPKLVIEKSTVPARTGEQLKRALQVYASNSGAKFRVASNPEFLREGTAVEDFFHPDRIVIGVEDKESERELPEIYAPILEGRFRCPVHLPNCPPAPTPDFVVTTIASAELIKHASNSFLGLKISYANVLADLCEQLGGNVEEVTRAVGLDPRIGGQFLKAGLGFGGFVCRRISRRSSRGRARRHRFRFAQGSRTREPPTRRPVAGQSEEGPVGHEGKTDWRPGHCLQAQHRRHSARPGHRSNPPLARRRRRGPSHRSRGDGARARVFPDLAYSADPYEVARGADALLVLTEWEQFRRLDWKRARSEMARPLVVDGRNMLRPAEMKALGFEYISFGRPEKAVATPAS